MIRFHDIIKYQEQKKTNQLTFHAMNHYCSNLDIAVNHMKHAFLMNVSVQLKWY
jgi:hypothetical protein